jgi:chloramphenicol 3-O-phosphotransferase
VVHAGVSYDLEVDTTHTESPGMRAGHRGPRQLIEIAPG